MYLDAQLLFSDKQKITQSAASEKVLDMGDNENSMPVYPLVQVTQGFEGLTSLTVHIQSAEKENPEEGDWQNIMTAPKLSAKDMEKPCTVSFGSLPPKAGRKLRVWYEAEGTATKGAVTAGLVLDRQA